MKWIVPTIVGAVILILVVIVVGMKISYTNQAIGLENGYSAQIDANKVIYDEVWKVLQQKAGVVSQYASDFKDIYVNLMNERYEGRRSRDPRTDRARAWPRRYRGTCQCGSTSSRGRSMGLLRSLQLIERGRGMADTKTKIGKLRTALLSGQVTSPLRAWKWWRMAHNTYHRCIWSLRHTEGLDIRARTVEDGGARYSMHWIHVNSATQLQEETNGRKD